MTKQKVSGMTRAPGKPRIGYKRPASVIKPEQYNEDVELRTAHDVRKLAGCTYCTGIGDKHHMIREGKDRYIHGRCFAMRDGIAAILALPKEVTDELTISDIGGSVMKALLEKNYP